MLTHSKSTLRLRQDFIDFFRSEQHKFLPPSKVYNDDPTIYFVNAGMNQLKSVFLGESKPKDGFTKLTNSQICIRAGGKHNDLDDVGCDGTHLTSFEMLGSWSLNDYGKERTIELMYKFLVQVQGLDPNRLYATYFEGNKQVPCDTETREIWLKYLPANHVVPGNYQDNFWTMGDSGPCGVCTEIHYDLKADQIDPENQGGGSIIRSVPEKVNFSDEVVELWNAVFMTYHMSNYNEHETKSDEPKSNEPKSNEPKSNEPKSNEPKSNEPKSNEPKSNEPKSDKVDKIILTPLPKMYVDTGMGLERLAMILQGQENLYGTDAFRYLFGYAQVISGGPFYRDTYPNPNLVAHLPLCRQDQLSLNERQLLVDIAYRIFVDGMRTVIVALFEGVGFGCHNKEFILKKIYRRVLTHLYLYLNSMTVETKMSHPSVSTMISDILNFHLRKRHDGEAIWNALMSEEQQFIGQIRYVNRKVDKYQKFIKRSSSTSNEIPNSHSSVTEDFKTLQTREGIPTEIIAHSEQLIFK